MQVGAAPGIIIRVPEVEESERIPILLAVKNARQLSGECHLEDPADPYIKLGFCYTCYAELLKTIYYPRRPEPLD